MTHIQAPLRSLAFLGTPRALASRRPWTRRASLLPALTAVCWALSGCGNDATPNDEAGGTAGSMAGSAGNAGVSAGGAGAGGTAGAGATAGTQGGSSASGAGGSAGGAGAGQVGGGAGGASGAAGGGGAGASGTSGTSGAGGNEAGAAGEAGSGTSGSSGGGMGGAAGESNAGTGGGGGVDAGAVALLMPTAGNEVSGTGVFTQDGENVVLTITLSDCPPGDHASHIHENKDCGDNGNAAGNHWVPEGEVIDDITCESDGTGMIVVTPPAGTWSIGEGDNDVTQFALMVHTSGGSNPGGRIACGVINAAVASVEP